MKHFIVMGAHGRYLQPVCVVEASDIDEAARKIGALSFQPSDAIAPSSAFLPGQGYYRLHATGDTRSLLMRAAGDGAAASAIIRSDSYYIGEIPRII